MRLSGLIKEQELKEIQQMRQNYYTWWFSC